MQFFVGYRIFKYIHLVRIRMYIIQIASCLEEFLTNHLFWNSYVIKD